CRGAVAGGAEVHLTVDDQSDGGVPHGRPGEVSPGDPEGEVVTGDCELGRGDGPRGRVAAVDEGVGYLRPRLVRQTRGRRPATSEAARGRPARPPVIPLEVGEDLGRRRMVAPADEEAHVRARDGEGRRCHGSRGRVPAEVAVDEPRPRHPVTGCCAGRVPVAGADPKALPVVVHPS
ncbi:sodium-dependent noradrenaline transporter, partial [Corchorus olitorius]